MGLARCAYKKSQKNFNYFCFVLGVSSHFPWGEESCAVYQYFLQSNPLYYSALLILLVYRARYVLYCSLSVFPSI